MTSRTTVNLGIVKLATMEVQSYRWKSNSCWLDTSLQILYVIMECIPDDFSAVFDPLPDKSAMKPLYTMLRERKGLTGKSANIQKALMLQRDQFRRMLKAKNVIKTISAFESLFVWFAELILLDDTDFNYRSVAAFETMFVDLHMCEGSKEIGGRHLQITKTPYRRRILQLSTDHHTKFEGCLAQYFTDFLRLDRHPAPSTSCWRVKDGVPLCKGDRHDLHDNVVSLPIILSFEIGMDRSSGPESNLTPCHWNIPPALIPDTSIDAESQELIYDLVGLALVNVSGTHFIARFVSGGSIYTYNDMENGGKLVKDFCATVETHLSGLEIDLPPGFVVYQTFYVLRGGLSAQDFFYRSRIKDVEDVFNLKMDPTLDSIPSISYQGDDLILMDFSARHWLGKYNHSNTLEYIMERAHTERTPSPFSQHSDHHTLSPTPTCSPSLQPTRDEVGSVMGTQSLPDSSWELNCRCGVSGDGNICYDADEYGRSIQCESCKDWSHIACQINGWECNQGPKQKFLCDNCNKHPIALRAPSRKSKRKIMEERTGMGKALEKRLWPGRGALALHGVFWYPVRLIIQMEDGWRVQWWRENDYALPGIERDSVTTVSIEKIRDSMWMDRAGRRKTRLGKWMRSHDVDNPEDITNDPSAVPFTEDINLKLSPFKRTLELLLLGKVDELQGEYIPIKDWLQKKKFSLSHPVGFSGPLTILQRSQISNWFEVNISRDKSTKVRLMWMGLLPITHVYTLYIATGVTRDDLVQIRRKEIQAQSVKKKIIGNTLDATEVVPTHVDNNEDEKSWEFGRNDYLDEAWNRQANWLPPRERVDVGRECLERLEQEMFEVSMRAGPAGNYQWGLDIGPYQRGFSGYTGLPAYLNDGTRDSDQYDEELGEGPDYREEPEPTKVFEIREMPKPLSRRSTRSTAAPNK